VAERHRKKNNSTKHLLDESRADEYELNQLILFENSKLVNKKNINILLSPSCKPIAFDFILVNS